MPAPKPGGAKRVGGGAKKVGGGGAKGGRGAKGAGAKKGGGAAKAGGVKPKPKGRSIGGGLSVNVRNSHLVGRGSSIDLIKPLSTQHMFRGQQSREELKRNPGKIADSSPTRTQRESSEGPSTGGSSSAGRYMRGLSVATDRMAMDRSMTNVFLACEEERHPLDRNKFNGSSLNLSKRANPTPGTSSHNPGIRNPAPSTSSHNPGLRSFGDNLRSNLQEKRDPLSKSQSDVDLTTLEKNSKEADPLLKIVKQKFSILSPIMSIDSVTSSKSKLKQSDPDKIQNTVGGTALTSSTPTALSSHMDPRLLQAASGIQGTGLMGAQLSTIPQDAEVPLDGQETPTSAEPGKFDAAVLATHPEQIGDGTEDEMLAEERIPSDPMKVKLIDAPAAEQVDGTPSPSLVIPPQASSAPPPEDLSSTPTTPGPVSPGLAPQLGTLPPQPSQLSGPLPATQLSAPAYSYEGYDSSPYGENLYNQQPGYDPLQDQYHMSAPLLENGHQGGGEHMYYPQPTPSRYPQNHKSYYHFSQMQSPDKYNFTKAIQNYDRASQNDGMYCYSCIMFFGVLMIGVGIIMIIVELFDLFGRHKDMPLAIAGGGTLALGITVLASAMLLWRRRRTNLKKKAAHV